MHSPTDENSTSLKITYSFEFAISEKNRYLRITRADTGGFIKHDWIIDIKNVK